MRETEIDYRRNTPEHRFPMARRWAAAGMIALIGTFGIQNKETIQAYYPFIDPIFGEADIVPDVRDCPPIPDEYSEIPLTEVNGSVHDVRSTARNFESAGIRPFQTVETIRTFFDYPQESYTSPTSGIEFVFYSDEADAGWMVDPEAFDELFHFSLTAEHEYGHPSVNHVVNCLRERIIDNREFAGKEYSIYIPSNPRTCLGNGRIINLVNTPDAACHQRGFAPPKLDVSYGPFEIMEGKIMILTGGRNDDTRYTSMNMNRLAFHESIHATTVLPGERSFRMDPNEKWAKYQERILLAEHREKFDQIAPFITFFNDVPPEILEAANSREQLKADFRAALKNNTKTAQ